MKFQTITDRHAAGISRSTDATRSPSRSPGFSPSGFLFDGSLSTNRNELFIRKTSLITAAAEPEAVCVQIQYRPGYRCQASAREERALSSRSCSIQIGFTYQQALRVALRLANATVASQSVGKLGRASRKSSHNRARFARLMSSHFLARGCLRRSAENPANVFGQA
jgi:hypothetical protein